MPTTSGLLATILVFAVKIWALFWNLATFSVFENYGSKFSF